MRHLNASRQKLTPHCLAAIFDSQLPHPNCLLECLPNCLSPTREGFFSSFKNCPYGEGNCAATERQKLSGGNFWLATLRCLSGPSGQTFVSIVFIFANRSATLALQPSWPLTGVIRALRARNPKKVEKSCRGALGPGVKKVEKKLKKGWKKSRKKVVFDSFLTFFRLFFNLF